MDSLKKRVFWVKSVLREGMPIDLQTPPYSQTSQGLGEIEHQVPKQKMGFRGSYLYLNLTELG